MKLKKITINSIIKTRVGIKLKKYVQNIYM